MLYVTLDQAGFMRRVAQTLILSAVVMAAAAAQQVISLPVNADRGASTDTYPEKQYFSKHWNTQVVSNVTKPSLTVYRPLPWTANGTAVVVCPGGGFMALSITSEGTDVAQWLSEKGFTTFVLKYRLAHTGQDATEEFQQAWNDKQRLHQILTDVVPRSIC